MYIYYKANYLCADSTETKIVLSNIYTKWVSSHVRQGGKLKIPLPVTVVTLMKLHHQCANGHRQTQLFMATVLIATIRVTLLLTFFLLLNLFEVYRAKSIPYSLVL